MAVAVFWFSAVFIGFVFVGYPLSLWLRSKLRRVPVVKADWHPWPKVSVIIAARNEQYNIVNRLQNILDQDYPKEKLEVIVVSNGSHDATVQTATAFANKHNRWGGGIIKVLESNRAGKPAALKLGVQESSGDYIVFADVRQRYEKTAIRELIRNFADPEVGAVSGELVFVDNLQSNMRVEMGTYWNYEKAIRRLESDTGSVMGATGAIYALKKNLFPNLPDETLLDDVYIPLAAVPKGYRVVFDQEAIAYDTPSKDMKLEWRRKVRTLAGNWQLLSIRKSLLNPFKNRYLLRFFWHKVARLAVPFVLISLLISSIAASGWLYNLALVMQLAVYITAALYLMIRGLQTQPVIRLCYFFCVMNIAVLYAFYVWVSGKCQTIWQR